MQLLVTADTTTLSYWFNWRVLLFAIWILSIMALSSFLLRKYECLDKLKSGEGETQQDAAQFLCNDNAWRPCLKEIHPFWMLVFRVIAFTFLLTTLIIRGIHTGGRIFFFYTEWTFILVTIYFGFGSLLSIYGCYQYHKITSGSSNVQHAEVDAKQGNFSPLIHEKLNPGIISYLFQVIFQMNAGAVMLTDSVFWLIIFPLLTTKDYKLNFVTVNMHTLNAVLLLGDTVLNCLQFPWFRISYFLLWTCIFVIFQWIVHAYISIRWPYPFLDLSSPYAPLWYLGMALMHIPCYGIFALVVKTKHYLLSRWFPQSYICLIL